MKRRFCVSIPKGQKWPFSRLPCYPHVKVKRVWSKVGEVLWRNKNCWWSVWGCLSAQSFRLLSPLHRDSNSSKDGENLRKRFIETCQALVRRATAWFCKKITTRNTVAVYASAGDRKIEWRRWIGWRIPLMQIPSKKFWVFWRPTFRGNACLTTVTLSPY